MEIYRIFSWKPGIITYSSALAKVEKGLEEANAAFTVASALMSPEMLEQALLYPKQSVELDMSFSFSSLLGRMLSSSQPRSRVSMTLRLASKPSPT